MQTRRGSVLGKRSHQPESPSAPRSGKVNGKRQLPTPDPSPKRLKLSTTVVVDGVHNKENVPPFNADASEGSPRTPTARRTMPAPPNTPTHEIAGLSLASPPITPPRDFQPAYARARALLRPTANGTDIEYAGRDAERKIISDFISQFAGDMPGDATSLYISGSPGCGKTALVNSVIANAVLDDNTVKVLSVNCMALKSIDTLWERLVDVFGGVKTNARSKAKGHALVELTLKGLKTKYILVLDELDHIASSAESMKSLFSLVSSVPDLIRIIGIANTHTLTSSTSTVVADVDHVQTIHFSPYTSTELLNIAQARLAPLSESNSAIVREHASKLVSNNVLGLLSKKIASMTGDVRALFEVLRGAIDLAVASSAATGSQDDLAPPPPPVVSISHILAALKSYTPAGASTTASKPAASSEICSKVQNLGLQAQLVMLSVVLSMKRTEAGLPLVSNSSGSASATSRSISPSKRSRSPMKRSFSTSAVPTSSSPDTNQLYSYYLTVLTRSSCNVFAPASRSEFGDLVGLLEGVGLLSLCSSSSSASLAAKAKRTFGRSSSFSNASGGGNTPSTASEVRLGSGVWADEILKGMAISSGTEEPGVVADEVVAKGTRSVWDAEMSRIKSDCASVERGRSKLAKASKPGDVFDDAFEA